ncbi:MAG TPA: hypothetical protein VG097_12455, partial [Gemmata sp.]|nr:hypothetical protein [Gemmata sp.]
MSSTRSFGKKFIVCVLILFVCILAAAIGEIWGDGDIGPIYAAALCPDGRHLVTAGYNSTIRFWDMSNGKEVRRFGRQHCAVSAVAVSPDGSQILATLNYYDGSPNQGMVLWDL